MNRWPLVIENRFKGGLVDHARFSKTHDLLIQAVSSLEFDRLVDVRGPTGIGKSTLLQTFERSLTDFVLENPDIGRNPPIIIDAKPSESGNFDFKVFYRQILESLNDPQYECLEGMSVNSESFWRRWNQELRLVSPTEFGEHVAKVLSVKKPIAVLIDEAPHMFATKSEDVDATALEVLKGWNNRGLTHIVMFGTLEFEEVIYDSSQLARRAQRIDFLNYKKTNDDVSELLGIVHDVLEAVEVNPEFCLTSYGDEIYDGSVGCVGTLVEWCLRACSQPNVEKNQVVSKADFDTTKLSLRQLESIEKSISNYPTSNSEGSKNYLIPFSNAGESQNGPHQKGAKNRPGLRNVTRDPLGHKKRGSN